MAYKSWQGLRDIHDDFLANEANFEIGPEDARMLIGVVGILDGGRRYGGYLSFQPNLSMAFELDGQHGNRFCAYLINEHGSDDGQPYDEQSQRTEVHFGVTVVGVTGNAQHIRCSDSLDWGIGGETDADNLDVRIIGEDALGMHESGGSASPIYTLISPWQRCDDGYMFFRTNIPVFDNAEHAEAYLNTGSKVGCVNIAGEPPYVASTAGKRYFYDMTLYRTATGDYTDKVQIAKRKFEIYNQDEFKMAGYCNRPAPYNVNFIAGRQENLNIKVTENNTVTQLTTLSALNAKRWAFSDSNNLIFDGEYYYFTDVYTNISMRGTKGQAQRVIDDIDNEDYSVCTLTNRTGTNIEFQENSDNNLNSGFMSAWITDYQGTLELRDILHSTNDTVRENIKKFADLWGQNPISTVPGMWYCPIDVSNFYESVPSRMAFGNVEVPYDMRYITDQKVVQIADVFINDTFGNFLDYTNISMQLYLPFVGLFEIEPALFFNRTMKIMCAIDFYNATIKYWIYADEKLVTDKTANIGCQLAVSGTDQVGRARESANAAKTVQSDLIQSAALGAVDPLYAAAKFTQTGVGLALGNSPEALSFKNKGAKMNSGSTSSGVSTYDILYPFLLIDTQNAIIPPALYQTYGMPCNYVGILGQCSGWTECCDVQLKGAMLPEEKEAIIEKLAKGVII